MCEDFTPDLVTKEMAVASRQCTLSHFLFHHGIFDQNDLTVVLYPPYSPDLADCDSSGSLIEVKCCYDTSEVIEAKSQRTLNTFTEHDLQDAF
jgi:hypothetical protein